MKKHLFLLLMLTVILSAATVQNSVCKQCHPTIFSEYYDSAHRKASVFNDPVHATWWKLMPKEKKGYSCAKCHTPSDSNALKKGMLTKNSIQKEEPISCVYCHTIERIQENDAANTNITTGKTREFFTAEVPKKGSGVAHFQTHTSWFGLSKSVANSPYHKINYNNENYYNGNVCMGCHAHTDNGHGFDLVMLDAYIDKKDKETCISCHMPQIPGTKVTLKETKTHAYHGIAGIHNMTEALGKYIDFNISRTADGFDISIVNHANHALFGQAYREGVLKVSIERNGKEIVLPSAVFTRIFGKDGKETLPWEATETLKDSLIYGKKRLHYPVQLQKGDTLTLILGVKRVSAAGLKALHLQNHSELSKFRPLKYESFRF
ncbi:hypothetical protein MNB_SV-4-917 [hydrothermal vent metagenome]|uniref:Cytochrome c-552/4 domain-containing protein n=1 Tax=hydrothermal vent metagenome TaxID=652676 RepID=A0A1W1E9G3_9ZZZZ